MLGLTVDRLKRRPSLLELLASHGVPHPQLDQSASPLPGPVPAIDPRPLPNSSTSHAPSTSSTHASTKQNMAPKEKKGSDALEQQIGSVFSISGPVIVAENMLGCAMYELVGPNHGILM